MSSKLYRRPVRPPLPSSCQSALRAIASGLLAVAAAQLRGAAAWSVPWRVMGAVVPVIPMGVYGRLLVRSTDRPVRAWAFGDQPPALVRARHISMLRRYR
jgi:hypothetical protein